MSQSGNSTYTKSMNGIITFDDGAGTVIEDGTVTTDNFSTTSFECFTIATGEITSKVLTDPIDICATTTGLITLGSSGKIKLGNSISITDKVIASTNTTDNIEILKATTGNIDIGGTGLIKLGNTVRITDNTITSSSTSDTINLFNDLNTGTLNICRMVFKRNNIATLLGTEIISLFNNVTTGIISMCNNSIKLTEKSISSNAVTDNISLYNNITTGTVSMAKTIFSQNSIASALATDAVSLFNNITTGTVSIAKTIFSQNSIASALATDEVSLFNNITTGSVSIAKFIFSQNKINSSLVSDTISLFDNVTTGSIQLMENATNGGITIGNAVATTGNGGAVNIGIGRRNNVTIGSNFNNSTAINNGCCTIEKLRIGTLGTGFRCVMMGTVAGGSGSGTVTITGGPTGFLNPIIFTSINIVSADMYMVMVNPTGTRTFDYRKRYYNGIAINDAVIESFNYIACWV